MVKNTAKKGDTLIV